jgi:hypothetical protein
MAWFGCVDCKAGEVLMWFASLRLHIHGALEFWGAFLSSSFSHGVETSILMTDEIFCCGQL